MVKKLGLREIGETFLKSCGKRGFSIKNDVQEARVFFERNYGINDISERNITVYITDNNSAVLYNNGEYIHKDFVDYKQIDIVTEILNRTTVDKYGIAARELFDNNFELLSSVNINNYYFLYGIIKKYNIGKFYCSGRSMRIYNEESNIDDVLISYIEDNGGIVKIEKLKEDLSIVNSTIQQKTMTILSKFDRDTITLRARFNISEFEKNELKKIIDAIIAKKRYCHSLDIIEIIYYDDNRNRFLKDNKINNNPTRLMYFLAVIFGNDYKYVHSINILTLHNLEINSIEDLVKIEFSNNIFTRKKVYDFLEKYGYSSSNVYNLHKQNVLPLGNARFIFKKELVYDEKLLFAINEVANRYFSNQLFILANELIRKLKLENIGAIYYNEPVKLVSVLSKYTHSNWIRPINDLPIDKSITDELLVNNSKFCNNGVTFKQLIKSFVYLKFKNYVTLDDINELLYNYELLKYKIPNEILESIFENELDSGLVKVVK